MQTNIVCKKGCNFITTKLVSDEFYQKLMNPISEGSKNPCKLIKSMVF